MAETFKYRAFISYSHRDKRWGDWLHKALETYRVPRRLIGVEGRDGPILPRLFPIFRDREELPTSDDLPTQITGALAQSAYLIVICSPNGAASRWVGEEILAFKRLGRENRILAIVIDGEPNASDILVSDRAVRPAECFPEALRYRLGADGQLSSVRAEPIAADARDHGDGRENAKLKLIAGLLGVGFDALKQRDLEAQRRRARVYQGIALAMGALAVAATGAGWFAYQKATEAEARRLEADVQRQRAEVSAAEAIRQRALAQTAATEANRQKALAQQSAVQANAERKRAEQAAIEADQQRLAANTQRNLAEQAATKAEVGQSRLLAFVANEQLRSGHAELASLLSLEALPRDLAHPDRPIVPEAAAALERSVRANRASGLLMQADNAISVAFDPGGMHLAVGDNRGDLSIYEIATGERTYTGRLLGDVMTGLAWSPRGDRIAVSGDKFPKLIAYPSMEVVATLAGHSRPVPEVRFSPDGRSLATASWDNSVKVWNAQTGALMTTMTPPAPPADAIKPSDQGAADPIVEAVVDTTKTIFGGMSRLAYSPDSARIATAGTIDREAVARLWDVSTGRQVAQLSVPHVNLGVDDQDVSFSPDGARLAASSGGSGDVYLWDSADHHLVATLIGHSAQVGAVRFSPDGSLLATASMDKTVRIWDGHTGALRHILMGHDSGINDIAFSPDGTRLVSVSGDGTLRIWNPANGAVVDVIQAHDFNISHATFSPYGTLIASVSQDATLKLWSAGRGEPSALPPIPVGNLLDNGPDGVGWISNLAASATSDNGLFLGLEAINGRIETYDTQTLRRKGLSVDELGQVWFMKFAGFGHRIVAANGRRLVELDMPSGQIVRQMDIGLEPPPPASLMHLAGAPAPDASYVIATDAERDAQETVTTARTTAILAGQDRFDVSPDGDLVLLPHGDAYEVWDFKDRRKVGVITAPLARIAAGGRTVWSLDGRHFELRSAVDLALISGGEVDAVRPGPGAALATISGGQVMVLDAASGKPTMKLTGAQADFSPDGDRLAVLDGADIAIEDLAERRQLARFPSPAPSIDRLVLSSDGQRLLAVAPGRAWLLDAASGHALATLATANPPPADPASIELADQSPRSNASGRLPAFSADGRAVAYIDDKARTMTISAADGSLRAVIDPAGGDTPELPTLVAISPDAAHLFVGTADETSVYDAHTGASLGQLPQNTGLDETLAGVGLSQLRFLADGSLALCDSCRSYDVETGFGLPPHTASTADDVHLGDTDCPQQMQVSPDGRWALCKRRDDSLFLIDARTRHVQAELDPKTVDPNDAVFSPDGKWLSYGAPQADADQSIRYAVRNIATGSVAFEQKVWNAGKPIFSPDSQWFAVGTSFGAIDMRHVGDWTSRPVRLGLLDATAPAFSPDGRLMMVGAGNGDVVVVATADASLVFKQKVHDGAVSALTFSDDSSLALTAGEDGAIHLWDTAAWVDLAQFRLADAPEAISDLRFSPDNTRIVAYANARAYVWNLVPPGWSQRPSLTDLADYARSQATRALTDDERRTYFLPAAANGAPTRAGAVFGLRANDAESVAPEIDRCDQAVSDPYDADRRAPAPSAAPTAADIETCRLGVERAVRDRPADLPRMKYLYGWALSFGQNTEAQTLELITQASEAGYPAAQRRLSDIYATGSLGVKADPATRMKWLELAAAGGDPLAVKALGVSRFNAARTDDEAREGLRLITEAADAGLPEANLELVRFALGVFPRYASADFRQALFRLHVCANGYAELADSAGALRCRGWALDIAAKLSAEDAIAAWRQARDFRSRPIAAAPKRVATAGRSISLR